MIDFCCSEAILAIDASVRNIRFALDPRAEFVEVVKLILELVMKEDLDESAAPGYLSAAYWELMSTEKFRKERDNND